MAGNRRRSGGRQVPLVSEKRPDRPCLPVRAILEPGGHHRGSLFYGRGPSGRPVAARRSGNRSRNLDLRRRQFDRPTRPGAVPGANCGHRAGRVQSAGGGAGGDRRLRNHGLRGVAAQARDRHSHGAGRAFNTSAERGGRQYGDSLAIGTVAGLALAFVAGGLFSPILYGVSAHDPLTYAIGIGLIALVACAACWIPARRAMAVDPAVALRTE